MKAISDLKISFFDQIKNASKINFVFDVEISQIQKIGDFIVIRTSFSWSRDNHDISLIVFLDDVFYFLKLKGTAQRGATKFTYFHNYLPSMIFFTI